MESSLKPDVNSVTFIIWSAHSPRNMILVGRSWLWPTGLPSTSGLSMPDLCWRYYFEDWGEGGEGSPGIRWRPPPVIKTLDSSIFELPPSFPFHVQLHASQHPPYGWEGVFVVSPMLITFGSPEPVILPSTPHPHGRLTAVPHRPPPLPPPTPNWTTLWPGCSARNSGK